VCVYICRSPLIGRGRALALDRAAGVGLGGEQVFEIERMFGANVCSIQAPGRRAAAGGPRPLNALRGVKQGL